MSGILDRIVELERKVAEQERRNRNRRRTGTIKEVDHGKGQYRVKIAEEDGNEFITDWIKPRVNAAGGVKVDVLLNEGEQIDVVSESGDMTDARIEGCDYSDSNARENSATPYHIKIGDTVLAMTGGEITLKAGTIRLEGDVVIEGPGVTHNGKNIGDTHGHVTAPPGPPGPPV